MPTYEYRCAQGHLFEQFQRMTEAAIDKCPTCGAPAERLLSAGAGLLFKGSGFYITDYRSDSYKKAAEADSGKASEGKPADTAGKPEKKADAGGGTEKKADAGRKPSAAGE